MKLDELESIYNKSWVASGSHRAGIRSVVAALRDEMVTHFKAHYTLDDGEIHTLVAAEAVGLIDSILGDAGNEKAAGDGTAAAQAVVGERDRKAPAADRSDDTNVRMYAEAIKSADPSPEGCEWTKGRDIFDGTRWSLPSCSPWTYAGVDYKTCPSCGKPITFKEPKP